MKNSPVQSHVLRLAHPPIPTVHIGIIGLGNRGSVSYTHLDVYKRQFDKDGKFLAVLYTDFHPRPGKRAGAWMTSYKDQWIDKKLSLIHIFLVMVSFLLLPGDSR